MCRYPEPSALRTASRVSSGGVWKTPRPSAGISTALLKVIVSMVCSFAVGLRRGAGRDDHLPALEAAASSSWVTWRFQVTRLLGSWFFRHGEFESWSCSARRRASGSRLVCCWFAGRAGLMRSSRCLSLARRELGRERRPRPVRVGRQGPGPDWPRRGSPGGVRACVCRGSARSMASGPAAMPQRSGRGRRPGGWRCG